MFDGITTALGYLVIIGVILYLAYVSSKHIGRTGKIGGRTQYMKMVSQLPVGQYGTIAIVQAGKKYLLLGMTSSQITILDQFDELEELENDGGDVTDTLNFRQQFERLAKRKK